VETRSDRSAKPATKGRREVLSAEPHLGRLGWIYVGVGIATVVLLTSAIWTKVTLATVAQPPDQPVITLEVTGYQWWWKVRYLSDDPSRTFTTANEIHIPVGQPVEIRLNTVDVIHSFWVPSLGGKIDLIPGQTNVTWLEANEPGVYRGQCAEYCGMQHTHMALLVVASSSDEFNAWWDAQLNSALEPVDKTTRQGQISFIGRCGACHAVRGTPAGGILGPDLSHLMTRRMIAAATLPNNVGALTGWIADPQSIKPGNFMPRPELTATQLHEIVAYLQTLE
jgi:cytochrome c oxidase subunit 2